MALTEEQKTLVRQSYASLIEVTDLVADLFYSRLFEMEPTARQLFKPDMNDQRQKLMEMIGMALAALDNLDELVPVVQALGRRHVLYGVTREQYSIVGAALLWTLEQALAEIFTPELLDAWAEVYNVLAQTAIEAAYGEAPTANPET
jgi:hemoglobin-like flavoprotein